MSGGEQGVGGAPGGDVAPDGDGALGEIGVPDDLAELLLGLEHPRGRPAQAHVAAGPVLDVARDARTVSIIDSHGFVEANCA